MTERLARASSVVFRFMAYSCGPVGEGQAQRPRRSLDALPDPTRAGGFEVRIAVPRMGDRHRRCRPGTCANQWSHCIDATMAMAESARQSRHLSRFGGLDAEE